MEPFPQLVGVKKYCLFNSLLSKFQGGQETIAGKMSGKVGGGLSEQDVFSNPSYFYNHPTPLTFPQLFFLLP